MVVKNKTVSIDLVRTWIYIIVTLSALVYYFGVWSGKVDVSINNIASAESLTQLYTKVAVLESTMPTQAAMIKLHETQASIQTDIKNILKVLDELKRDFKFFILKSK